MADQILAVAGDGRGAYLDFVAADSVDLEKLSADDLNRISAVGIVIRVKDFTVFSYQDELCRRRTAVDAQISVALVGCGICKADGRLRMSVTERLIFFFVFEKRRQS